MESYVMTVTCSPRLSTLARIIAVLHARKAAVTDLHCDMGPQQAEVSVGLVADDVDRLAAQIRRLVDVTDVHLAGAARVAVAS